MILNLSLFPKSKSTSKELIKRLNNKEIFALFSDHRDKGALVNFFGMETVLLNMPLIWGYNYFNSDNNICVC